MSDPDEEIVLEPAFHWAPSDESGGLTKVVVCSNCDHLKFYLRESGLEASDWKLAVETRSRTHRIQSSTLPPFILSLNKFDYRKLGFRWGDLRIDGFIKGQQVISKSLSGRGVDRKFTVRPDDTALFADGADSTRVVLRVTDEFDAIRTYANDPIVFTIDGPAEIIGEQSLFAHRWNWRHLDPVQRTVRDGSPHRQTSTPRLAYSRLYLGRGSSRRSLSQRKKGGRSSPQLRVRSFRRSPTLTKAAQ